MRNNDLEKKQREEIGKRIKSLFRRSGIKKSEVRDELGCTWGLVNKWSTGESLPGHFKLISFCKRMGVSIDYVLTGENADLSNQEVEKLKMNLEEYKEMIKILKENNELLKEKIKLLEEKKPLGGSSAGEETGVK